MSVTAPPPPASPRTSKSLTTIEHGGRRWPVVDGVAMMRTGRDELVDAVLRCVDRSDRRGALRLLLNDRDDFDRQPPASVEALDAVIDDPASDRYATMRRLNFAAVADYFAIRPSTPTFLSGLNLLAAIAGGRDLVVDVGCGVGQLSAWFRRAVGLPRLTAIDTVFAKVWLARRWFGDDDHPNDRYLAADVCGGPLPIDAEGDAAVLCHDAFYFFPDKPAVASELVRLAGPGGVVGIGHVHHAATDAHGVGDIRTTDEYRDIFAAVATRVRYIDDAAMIRPRPIATWTDDPTSLGHTDAFTAVLGDGDAIDGDVHTIREPAVANPLIEGDAVRWPAKSFAREYAHDADFLTDVTIDPVFRRSELPASMVIDHRRRVDVRPRAVRWAVVGCGWVARDYGIPGIRDADGGTLAVCVDRDDAALRRVRETLGDEADRVRFSDGLDPADLSGVDAVYVATPNHAHLGPVRELAAMGKHVLCEKPLSSRPGDAPEMLAAGRSARVVLAAAYDQRHHPAHRAIRDLVAAGELGTITQVRIHYACWLPGDWSPDGREHDNWRVDAARSGGGAAIDLAPHGVDLVEFLTGTSTEIIHAMFQSPVHRYGDDPSLDDGAVLSTRTDGDVLASIAVSYACPDAYPRRRLEVIGTAGMIVAENTMGQTAGGRVTLHRPDGSSDDVAFDPDVGPFRRQIEWFGDRIADPDHHAEMLELVAGQIRTHQRLLTALNAAADRRRGPSHDLHHR